MWGQGVRAPQRGHRCSLVRPAPGGLRTRQHRPEGASWVTRGVEGGGCPPPRSCYRGPEAQARLHCLCPARSGRLGSGGPCLASVPTSPGQKRPATSGEWAGPRDPALNREEGDLLGARPREAGPGVAPSPTPSAAMGAHGGGRSSLPKFR